MAKPSRWCRNFHQFNLVKLELHGNVVNILLRAMLHTGLIFGWTSRKCIKFGINDGDRLHCVLKYSNMSVNGVGWGI